MRDMHDVFFSIVIRPMRDVARVIKVEECLLRGCHVGREKYVTFAKEIELYFTSM